MRIVSFAASCSSDTLNATALEHVANTFDAYLHEGWINEHLQPNAYRLAGNYYPLHSSTAGELDLIVPLETLSADWQIIARLGIGARLSPKTRAKLAFGLQTKNARGRPRTAKTAQSLRSSKLTSRGVQKMCRSALYAPDWECFGYPLPDPCRLTNTNEPPAQIGR